MQRLNSSLDIERIKSAIDGEIKIGTLLEDFEAKEPSFLIPVCPGRGKKRGESALKKEERIKYILWDKLEETPDLK